jgi:hypothetical protein
MDSRLKDLRGPSRRQFLRWSATVAALLGLERARFLDWLAGSGGNALADTAQCANTSRSVHLVAGNGGFAHFQLIWPHNVIAQSTNDAVAFHALGKATPAPTDKPMFYAPESPFQKLPRQKQVSAFMAGSNETHTNTPSSAASLNGGVSMLAAVAAIQQANPTLLPVIGVNPVQFGNAPGAPAIATVGGPSGLVDLFNSAASRTLLAKPQTASLNEAYYKAFLGLNAAAGRPGVARGFETGKVAANLLGQNLADKLRAGAQDEAAYGIDAGTPTALADLAHALITAVKAFQLGLTSSLILPVYRDDPHGLFGGGNDAAQKDAAELGKILDGFMAHAGMTPDPSCSSRSLADNLVLTVHGDTPKDPFTKNGWPDGTAKNSNWIYVMGNGFLKTGWFGGVKDQNSVDGFDPTTGAIATDQTSDKTANEAAAAVAYAVAKGDMRRVNDFYRGPGIDGIVNLQVI